MTEEQNTQKGTDLETYIKDFKEQVKKGLGEDASISSAMELEISTTLEKSRGAGFKISVLRAGAEIKNEQVHKIKIPIKFVSEVDKKEEQARIAEAEAKRKEAEKKKVQSENNKRGLEEQSGLARAR